MEANIADASDETSTVILSVAEGRATTLPVVYFVLTYLHVLVHYFVDVLTCHCAFISKAQVPVRQQKLKFVYVIYISPVLTCRKV